MNDTCRWPRCRQRGTIILQGIDIGKDLKAVLRDLKETKA